MEKTFRYIFSATSNKVHFFQEQTATDEWQKRYSILLPGSLTGAQAVQELWPGVPWEDRARIRLGGIDTASSGHW